MMLIVAITLLIASVAAQDNLVPELPTCSCPIGQEQCLKLGRTWKATAKKERKRHNDKRCSCLDVGGVCCEPPVCVALSCSKQSQQVDDNGCAACPKCEQTHPLLPTCSCPLSKQQCLEKPEFEWVPKPFNVDVLPLPEKKEKRNLEKRCSCVPNLDNGTCCTRAICPAIACGLGQVPVKRYNGAGCRLCDECVDGIEPPILPPCNCPVNDEKTCASKGGNWLPGVMILPAPDMKNRKRCSCAPPIGTCCMPAVCANEPTSCPAGQELQATTQKNGCDGCKACKPIVVVLPPILPPCNCAPHNEEQCEKQGGSWLSKAQVLPVPHDDMKMRKRCSCIEPEDGRCCLPVVCANEPTSCPAGQELRATTQKNGCDGCKTCQPIVVLPPILPPCNCPVNDEKTCSSKGGNWLPQLPDGVMILPADMKNRKRCSCAPPIGTCCMPAVCANEPTSCPAGQELQATTQKNGCDGCKACKPIVVALPPILPPCHCAPHNEEQCEKQGGSWLPGPQVLPVPHGDMKMRKRCSCIEPEDGRCCLPVLCDAEPSSCPDGEELRLTTQKNGCVGCKTCQAKVCDAPLCAAVVCGPDEKEVETKQPNGCPGCSKCKPTSCECDSAATCSASEDFVEGAKKGNCACDGACCARLECDNSSCPNGDKFPTDVHGCPRCCNIVDGDDVSSSSALTVSLAAAFVGVAVLQH